MSEVFSKPCYSSIDGITLIRQIKCAGLTFDIAADEIFNAALNLLTTNVPII